MSKAISTQPIRAWEMPVEQFDSLPDEIKPIHQEFVLSSIRILIRAYENNPNGTGREVLMWRVYRALRSARIPLESADDLLRFFDEEAVQSESVRGRANGRRAAHTRGHHADELLKDEYACREYASRRRAVEQPASERGDIRSAARAVGDTEARHGEVERRASQRKLSFRPGVGKIVEQMAADRATTPAAMKDKLLRVTGRGARGARRRPGCTV